MRILHLTDSEHGVPGGRETHIRRFSAGSEQAGHASITATVEDVLSPSLRPGSAPPDIAILHSTSAWTHAQEIRRSLPSATLLAWVHDQSFVCPASISWFRKSRRECWLPLGTHCVTNAYRLHCNSRRPDRNIGNCLRVRRTLDGLDSIDGVIVASRYMQARLVAGGVPENVIHVLPYFVNEKPKNVSATIRSQRLRILYVGRLNETKGVDVLIQSMSHLPECSLTIVGDGYIMPDLVRLASRDPSVQSRIRFAGQITDEGLVDDEYASSDVLAVPSLWPEPFGIVGLEAMQHALPVVASRTGGIPEWLLDGETGYLTQPDDALDLAAKLSMLAESETLRDEFGQRALAHVRETFSWERHWERFVQIVEAARRFQAT